MTLDITIGKITIRKTDNKAFVDVVACPPEANNVCNPAITLWPKEAYRSGSSTFWGFFRAYMNSIYVEMRDNPDSNDRDVAFVKPFLHRINKLPDKCADEADTDRMKWLKFWCNKAVELYEDEAGIMFC